jgi:hypothetical protein
MILQALKEYYDRKPDLPRPGFELKEIPFVLTLNPDGTPVSLTPTYEGEGKARRAKRYLIPQAVKRSVGIAANLLWDNPEYVLGTVLKGKPDRVKDQHAAFKQRIEDLKANDAGVVAVRAFLAKPDKADLLAAFGESWEELKKTGANLSFQLAGQPGLIVEQPAVQAAITAGVAGTGDDFCLVTGNRDVTERLHTAIKGVWGAQSSGANIISFNLDAFLSRKKVPASLPNRPRTIPTATSGRWKASTGPSTPAHSRRTTKKHVSTFWDSRPTPRGLPCGSGSWTPLPTWPSKSAGTSKTPKSRTVRATKTRFHCFGCWFPRRRKARPRTSRPISAAT